MMEQHIQLNSLNSFVLVAMIDHKYNVDIDFERLKAVDSFKDLVQHIKNEQSKG